jgi:hypothetical protein
VLGPALSGDPESHCLYLNSAAVHTTDMMLHNRYAWRQAP